MSTTQINSFKHKKIEDGQRIVLIKPIQNGLIELKPFASGQIIYLQNQAKATVWFRHIGHYASDSIAKALNVDTSYGKNGRLDGVTLELKRESFAIKCEYNGFNDLTVYEDKALEIPFFEIDKSIRFPSNMKKNIGNGVFEVIYLYELIDVADIIEDAFANWVEKKVKMRPITKEERENEEYPKHRDNVIADNWYDKFYEKKQEVELAFAKATGIFYEFNGGLIFD